MDIKSLKSLLKVLRDSGVTSYEHDGVKLSLSDLPVSKESLSKPSAAIPEDYETPSEEDLLFYSSVPPSTDNQ